MWRTGFGKDPWNGRHTCTDGTSTKRNYLLENLTDEQRVSVLYPETEETNRPLLARPCSLFLISTLPCGGLSPCPKYKEENCSPR